MTGAIALAIILGRGQQGKRFVRELIARPGYWIQQPVTLQQMHGKVVLLDYWDYTCVNCIRTFPYLKEWYRRYHRYGLEIVGIHTPEFLFAHDPAKVRAAVQRFGLPYHILNDPKRENWWQYGAWAWPTKILLDSDGSITLFRVGEGNYGLFERSIQEQLHKVHPGAKFPPLMVPLRGTDVPGAICYPKTPEIYTWIKGLPRKELCYTASQMGAPATFSYPAVPAEGVVYLSGPWTPQKHYLEAGGTGSDLMLGYMAKEVNTVLTPSRAVDVEVRQDGRPLKSSEMGDDVRLENGQAILHASLPRMYSLIKNPKWGHHQLELRARGAGLQILTFSFSTDCDPGKK